MEYTKLKLHSLDEIEDRLIGVKGTPQRDEYEFDLKIELLGEMIKAIRKKQNLTQDQLGNLIGVKKSQISRLEGNTKNVTVGTLLRVFGALKTKIVFKVETPDAEIEIK